MAKNWPIFWSIPTLIFSHLLVRNLFGARAALLTIGLIVLHPTYVMGIRIGGALLSHMQFFSMGSLCFLSYWWTTRRKAWLFLSMFFVGLGLSTQLWFYWFVAGLSVLGLLSAPEIRIRLKTGKSFPTIFWAATCLCAGAALIIYREISHGFRSIETIFMRTDLLESAHPVTAYLAQFTANLRQFNFHLASRSLLENTLSIHPDELSPLFPFSNWLVPWVFWPALLFLFARPVYQKIGKRAFLLPVLFVVMLLLSGFAPRGGVHLHLFFLYPLPLLIYSTAFSSAWKIFAHSKLIRRFLATLLSCLLLSESVTLGRYLFRFFKTPNASFYTSTIYDAADWLKSQSLLSHPFAVFDDRMEVMRHFYFLFPDHDLNLLRISELHPNSAPNVGFTPEAEKALSNGLDELIFVRHTNDIHRDYMAMVERLLAPRFEIKRLVQFPDVFGNPTLEIYSLKPIRNVRPTSGSNRETT